MNVYLDDVRKAPIGWMQTRTAAETIETIIDYQGEINTLSLDHDLGACNECLETHGGSAEQWLINSNYKEMPHCEHFGTGYEVALFLEEMAYNNPTFIFPTHVQCHSANPVGRQRIERVIEKLKQMNKIT